MCQKSCILCILVSSFYTLLGTLRNCIVQRMEQGQRFFAVVLIGYLPLSQDVEQTSPTVNTEGGSSKREQRFQTIRTAKLFSLIS